jgi:hypothetical protein
MCTNLTKQTSVEPRACTTPRHNCSRFTELRVAEHTPPARCSYRLSTIGAMDRCRGSPHRAARHAAAQIWGRARRLFDPFVSQQERTRMSVGAYLHSPRNVDVRPRKRRRVIRRLQPVHERLEEECCGAAARGLTAGLHIANRPSISVQEDWTGARTFWRSALEEYICGP